MITYIPGFAPLYTNEPDPSSVEVKGADTFIQVAQAMASAQARQAAVLDYTRTATVPSPLKVNLRTDGPTLEVWVAAGYQVDKYPPDGYAELPSPMLEAHQKLKATLNGPHSVTDTPEVT